MTSLYIAISTKKSYLDSDRALTSFQVEPTFLPVELSLGEGKFQVVEVSEYISLRCEQEYGSRVESC